MIVLRLLRRAPHALIFAAVFVYDLVVANIRVAWEVLTPGFSMHAAIVRVPTSTRTPMEVTVLANVITMTPGTLSLEVDPSTYDIYVHGLYVESVERFREGIGRTERLLLKAMR